MRKLLTVTAIACACLAVASCSRDAGNDAGNGEAESTTSTTSASASGNTSESPSGTTLATPETCRKLTLAEGAEFAGSDLGACVADGLASAGSGRMQMIGAGGGGTIEFTFNPEYSFQGEMTSDSGNLTLTYIDGTLWMDSGSGPVKGDVNSSNPEEQMAGAVADLYRTYSDPTIFSEPITLGERWTVGALEPVDLPNGQQVEAYRITNADQFDWSGVNVQHYVVWFTPEWVPVGTEVSVDVLGQVSTSGQLYYDLGEPVDIQPVG